MREGWEYKKLGEVCEVFDSMRKPVTKKDRKEGNYPYYGATGIQDYVDSYLFDGRYLLVGEDGAKWGANEGTSFIIEGKSWVNNHAHIIQLNKDVNDILVKYYLNFKDLSDYITGAVVPKLTQQALKNIQIPIPPLTTQQQIVSELDLLSHIIDQKRQQLKEYDALAESIFYDMFGDPNNSSYELTTISELAKDKLTYGSMASAVPFDGEIRYLRITDILPDGSLSPEIMSPNTFDEKYILEDGDILFARSGATVGKTYCYKERDGIGIYAGYLIRMKPNKDKVLPLYIYYFTRTTYYKAFIEANSNAVAQPNVNAKQYGGLKLPLPPLDLQRQFAAKIESIEQQKQLLKESIKETEMLFQSRMDYWFNS